MYFNLTRYILLILGFFFIESTLANEVISIAASEVPHAQILQQVKPILKKQGIDLQIKEFSDYIQPNLLVEQKQLDANFFQHRPYLEQFNKDHNTHLVELIAVHIEPMGLYAASENKLNNFIKSKDLTKLPLGLTVGVPTDTTNEGRALLLLQKNGIIKIRAGVSYPTSKDIVSNPYQIKIKELDAPMLPRVLIAKQLDLAVINSNFVLQAGLNPLKDAVFIEDANSPYANIVAVRPNEINTPKMKALASVLHSQLIKDYILKTYHSAVIPAF